MATDLKDPVNWASRVKPAPGSLQRARGSPEHQGQLWQGCTNPSKHTSPPLHLAALPVKSREGSGKEGSVEHKVPHSLEMSTPRAQPSEQGAGCASCPLLSPYRLDTTALPSGHDQYSETGTTAKLSHRPPGDLIDSPVRSY